MYLWRNETQSSYLQVARHGAIRRRKRLSRCLLLLCYHGIDNNEYNIYLHLYLISNVLECCRVFIQHRPIFKNNRWYVSFRIDCKIVSSWLSFVRGKIHLFTFQWNSSIVCSYEVGSSTRCPGIIQFGHDLINESNNKAKSTRVIRDDVQKCCGVVVNSGSGPRLGFLGSLFWYYDRYIQ